MRIPTYQIYNVLKAFTNRLCQGEMVESEKGWDLKPAIDSIKLSAEGKRQTIIDRVAADIVARISRFGLQDIPKDAPLDMQKDTLKGKIDDELANHLQDKKETQFIFNVIDVNSNKTTHTLSVKDPRFIMEQLEQLAKKAVDDK